MHLKMVCLLLGFDFENVFLPIMVSNRNEIYLLLFCNDFRIFVIDLSARAEFLERGNVVRPEMKDFGLIMTRPSDIFIKIM